APARPVRGDRSARRAQLEAATRLLAERSAERGGLEPGLGELALGIRVGHDPAARVVAYRAAGHDRRPDGEAELEVAARIEEAERAGVRTARPGLELADDLHGTHLGSARDRAARERGAQEIRQADLEAQPARNRRHEVVHRRMALDHRVTLDGNRTHLAHAPEVVALEVDDHHVLGALLRVAEELRGERRVVARAVATRARALDGPRLDAPSPPP